MRRYTVVLIPEPEEGGYSVTVPFLPGLFTQGDTREEALDAAREAIEFHLECLAAEGEAVPDEGAVLVEHVEVAAP
jgi:predicted RNase H-like HicB family nuclease